MTLTSLTPVSLLRTSMARAVMLACTSLAASFVTSGAFAQAPAKPDPAKGREIAANVCSACHGADGNSAVNINPKLAGQHPEYLVKQLNDFAKKPEDKTARVNAVMAGFASALSAQERAHVAAWFSTQKPQLGTAKNSDTLDLGAQIYRAGLPEKGIPACAGCHSPNGAGIPAQYPRLSGQFSEYTEAQIKAFRDGTRRNSTPMTQIATRLSDKEAAAVADYIAGLR